MRRGTLIVLALALASVLGVAAPARAEEPSATIYQVCLRPADHTERAIERGVCDAYAEAAGFSHGVLQPFRCMPDEPCVVWLVCATVVGDPVDPGEHYMCAGVPRPAR